MVVLTRASLIGGAQNFSPLDYFKSPAIFIFLLFAGCSSLHKTEKLLTPDSLIHKTQVVRKSEFLTPVEIKEDIKILIYGLETAYVGRVTIPSEQWRKSIAQIKEIQFDHVLSINEFCEQIEVILKTLPDNHLKIGCKSSKYKYQVKIGKNITQPPAIWSFNTKSNIAQIGILSFPDHQEKIWNGFEDRFKNILKANALIIDLRGNPGGDDTMGKRLAKFLLGAPPPLLIEKKITSKTPETFALFLNFIYQEISYYEKLNQTPPEFLFKEKMEMEQELAIAKSGKYPPIEIKEFPKPSQVPKLPTFNKEIFVIIDNGCGSSCESTLDALRVHPKVKVIGQNSMGKHAYGNVLPLTLPNSALDVILASHHWQFTDNKHIEKVGYTPDVLIKDGEDAMAIALGLAK